MKTFITFGAGDKNYIEAARRLVKQVQSTGYFDNIKLFTDKELIEDNNFWKKHKLFITKNKRGFGYWIWKPYIIKKTLESMKEGDILMYLDCGCEVGGEKKLKISDFFEYVKKDKIIGSIARLEKKWCKYDLIDYMNVHQDKIVNTNQRQASAIMYLVCNETINLVNKWYEICCNYHLIDDSVSKKKNFKKFRDHRHDQAVFSLLTKKYDIYSEKNMEDCIYIIRNRTGNTIIN